ELARHSGDQLRRLDGRRVDADLFGAGLDEACGVLQGTDTAADGEGHEDFLGHAAHNVEQDLAAFVAGTDVEKDQFVGPLLLVAARHLDRIAGVSQPQEVHPLDNPAALDVQTRDNALGQHTIPRYLTSPPRGGTAADEERSTAKETLPP